MADDAEESDNDISLENQTILLEFQEITGIDDLEECKQLLTVHRWDLQIAVQDTLNKAEGQDDVYWQEEREDSESDQQLENPGPNVAPATMGWPHWLFSITSFPFRFVISTISDFCRFIIGLVWPSLIGANRTALEDVLSFKEDFERRYGRIHPTFYEGSYSQAIEDAKKELRFLLIYLHSSEHKETEQFCRSTLTNEGFKEYVNGNMLFWAADVQTREGYRVSCALRETTYPFMAVACLRDNRMMVVGRLQGILNVDAYIARLTQILDTNESSLIAARADRAERSFNQTLRAEQDAAYEESLKADQEKERQKSLEAETKRLEEEKKKDKEQSLQNKIKAIAEKRERLLKTLPAEPDASDAKAIRIGIRLPHGERMDRYFLKTDRLQSLFDYVFCNNQCPHVFKLVSHYPRQEFELDCENEVRTLEDVGLTTSATLFVQDMTEENCSEED